MSEEFRTQTLVRLKFPNFSEGFYRWPINGSKTRTYAELKEIDDVFHLAPGYWHKKNLDATAEISDIEYLNRLIIEELLLPQICNVLGAPILVLGKHKTDANVSYKYVAVFDDVLQKRDLPKIHLGDLLPEPLQKYLENPENNTIDYVLGKSVGALSIQDFIEAVGEQFTVWQAPTKEKFKYRDEFNAIVQEYSAEHRLVTYTLPGTTKPVLILEHQYPDGFISEESVIARHRISKRLFELQRDTHRNPELRDRFGRPNRRQLPMCTVVESASVYSLYGSRNILKPK